MDYLKRLNKAIPSGAHTYSRAHDQFSSNTAAISSYMLRSVGAKYTLVGHSDNRSEGDTDSILKNKVYTSLEYFYGNTHPFLVHHILFHKEFNWSINWERNVEIITIEYIC